MTAMMELNPEASLGPVLLRQWRGATSRVEVARRFGIDPAVYSKFERGRRRPGGRWAALIEEFTSGAVPAASWWQPASRADGAQS